MAAMGGGGRPPVFSVIWVGPRVSGAFNWLLSAAPAPRLLLIPAFLGFGERIHPGQGSAGAGPSWQRLSWEPAGSAFIIVPPAPGTG